MAFNEFLIKIFIKLDVIRCQYRNINAKRFPKDLKISHHFLLEIKKIAVIPDMY